MNDKSGSGSGSESPPRTEVFRFELNGGVIVEITVGIAYNGVGLGRPIPPVPQEQQRLVSWSMHPVGIDQVAVLQVIQHG